MNRLILGIITATLTGCSVSPAPLLTIPQGHPGNAESVEAPYTPPVNPFKQDVPEAAPPGQKDSPQDHSNHDHGQGKASETKKPYPLDVCLVGGEKLGSMGKPVVLQQEGREVRFCCPACVATFKKDPGQYLKKLDEAEKKKSSEDKSRKHDDHEGHP